MLGTSAGAGFLKRRAAAMSSLAEGTQNLRTQLGLLGSRRKGPWPGPSSVEAVVSAAHTVAQAGASIPACRPCQLRPCRAAGDSARGQGTSSRISQGVRAGSGQESRCSSGSAGASVTAALGGAGRRGHPWSQGQHLRTWGTWRPEQVLPDPVGHGCGKARGSRPTCLPPASDSQLS